MFKLLIQYSKLLPLEREVMAVYYRLLAVIVLECGKNKLNDCLHLIIKLQVHYKYEWLIANYNYKFCVRMSTSLIELSHITEWFIRDY